jgi:hypothetical protein
MIVEYVFIFKPSPPSIEKSCILHSVCVCVCACASACLLSTVSIQKCTYNGCVYNSYPDYVHTCGWISSWTTIRSTKNPRPKILENCTRLFSKINRQQYRLQFLSQKMLRFIKKCWRSSRSRVPTVYANQMLYKPGDQVTAVFSYKNARCWNIFVPYG